MAAKLSYLSGLGMLTTVAYPVFSGKLFNNLLSKWTMNDPRQGKQTIKSERPWGDIHMVVRNQRCSVDLTHVRPGQRASLHSHAERYELFHFLDSGAYLEIDGQIHRPAEHDEFLIEPGQKHRFWAGDGPFRMLVVCFGEWRVEDQVRHKDDYGREGEKLEI